MIRYNYLLLSVIVLLVPSLYSCHHQHRRDEVEAAMQQYNRLLKKLDADSLSLLFTPDGELGEQAKGRSNIKKYLSSFSNVNVLSQTSFSDSIDITKDTAYQKGHYNQVVVVSPPDTLKLHGEFMAHWIWYDKTGWLIQRIDTRPTN